MIELVEALAPIAAAALLGGALGVLGTRRGRWMTRIGVSVAAAAVTGGVAGAWPGPSVDPELASGLPERRPGDGYVSSMACRSCHPSQHASWQRTFHRTMTQVATPEAVVAPFDGRVLRDRGRAFVVVREAERFYVAEVDPERTEPLDIAGRWWEGLESIWRVTMTTGSHQLQAYWVESPRGDLMQFPFVYLIREERWLANAASFLQPPPAPDAPLKRFGWSFDCAQCHSTGGPWDPEGDVVDASAVTELGIACEACHGPGEEHVRLNGSPLRRYALHAGGDGDPSITNPARLDPTRSASVCGRCHSVHPPEVEGQGALAFRPGDRLTDHLPMQQVADVVDAARTLTDLSALSEDDRETVSAFWSDGTVRVAGREYNGLTRSGCHTEGALACTGCHSMHEGPAERQMDPARAGDAMCAECHAAEAAAADAHTHHAAGSAGSACVDCHMPYAAYGLLAGTRSHRIDAPTASGRASRDRPNACNLCHLDRSLGWTADHLARWYGQRRDSLDEVHERVPAAAVWMLRGDAAQRGIAAWHVGWEPARRASDEAALRPVLAVLLEDPYAAVRQLAAVSLRSVDPDARIDLDAVTAAPRPADHRRLRAAYEPGVVDGATIDALLRERDDTPTFVSE